MFERRLKIYLLILAAGVCGLLCRAAQLQFFQRDYWRHEAADTLRKVRYLDTDRGPILDCKGRELAADRPCVDACVDYRAIIYPADPKWLSSIAANRVKARLGDAWSHTPRKQRDKLRDDEIPRVQDDINAMWGKLAEVSGRSREEIEEDRQAILQRVSMRKKYIWWHAYSRALKKGGGDPDAGESTIEKLLAGGDSDESAQIDKFSVTVAEETQPHVILHAISLDVQNELGRHIDRYPGLILRPGLHRYYPYEDVACHVLGNLGRVNREDLQNDPNKHDPRRAYLPNDDIGRGGLEWLCEPALRGTLGRVTTTYGEDASTTTEPPVPGQAVRTTIDIDLQQEIQSFFASATLHGFVEGRLQETERNAVLHGAAVLLDVKTNRVLALVSYPTYDLNHFDEMYQKLHDDEINDPLRDRATESQLETGSTMKPLVGLGAITSGTIGVNEGIECTGYLILPWNGHPHKYTRMGRCWVASMFEKELGPTGVAHHPVPFPHRGHDGNPDGFLTYSDALERSCNVYFETVADRMGMDLLTDWMKRFGLGRKTGIGIEEYKGRVPGDAGDNFGMQRRTNCFYGGIGQGYVAATPIQMANVAATIARGGIWMRPQLVMPEDKTGKLPPVRAGAFEGPDVVDLHLNPKAVAACRLGMYNVVNAPAGTGKAARMDDLVLCAKTGTAQAAKFKVPIKDAKGQYVLDENGKRTYKEFAPSVPGHPNPEVPWYRGAGANNEKIDHSWMIGFAPADDPKIAFAVLVEYGGSGGGAAADVVKTAMEACIAHGYLQAQSNAPKPEEPPSQQASAAPARHAALPAGSELLTSEPETR
jgi:penicillin-binding protein 2